MLESLLKKPNHCSKNETRIYNQVKALKFQNWPFLLIGCLVCLVCCSASNQLLSDLTLNNNHWHHAGNIQRLLDENMSSRDEAELESDLNDYVEYFQQTRFNQGDENLETGHNLMLTIEDFCSRYPAECRTHRPNIWAKCNGFALVHISGGTQTANCLAYSLLQDKEIAKIALAAFRNRQFLEARETFLARPQWDESSFGGSSAPFKGEIGPKSLTESLDNEEKRFGGRFANQSELQQHGWAPKIFRTTATTTQDYMEPNQQLSTIEQEFNDHSDRTKWLDLKLSQANSNKDNNNDNHLTPANGRHYRSGHQLETRAWRLVGSTPESNTYRVSADEAREFIKSQQDLSVELEHQQNHPSIHRTHLFPQVRDTPLYLKSKTVPILGGQGERINGKLTSNENPVVESGSVRLHRSESSPAGTTISRQLVHSRGISGGQASNSKRLYNNGGVLESIGATTTRPSVQGSVKNTLAAKSSSATIPTKTSSSDTSDQQQLGCNKRLFTFRAIKRDSIGNHCSGLIRATICYGSCDTGEISDWLFPGKKSIHKVCRHGQRIRRQTILTDCNRLDVEPSLRYYHYVDAADCVCEKCISTDTTCLGTMARPHLQTLDEAVASLGSIPDLEY